MYFGPKVGHIYLFCFSRDFQQGNLWEEGYESWWDLRENWWIFLPLEEQRNFVLHIWPGIHRKVYWGWWEGRTQITNFHSNLPNPHIHGGSLRCLRDSLCGTCEWPLSHSCLAYMLIVQPNITLSWPSWCRDQAYDLFFSFWLGIFECVRRQFPS